MAYAHIMLCIIVWEHMTISGFIEYDINVDAGIVIT